ncbi:MAG TPA: 3-oxoacyl-[acyl-carrier-protein] synthase III C-terminal domain-containing protein [Myxococcota bacterium]|nr:3-oxoacyl-[acyl-carrier-protein] synthase III C-terminal domain-containing protein [Myxococcota bacterium]
MNLPLQIVSMGKYIPRRKVLSAELDERLGLREGWIARHQGIQHRYWAEDDETASQMGARAVEDALAQAGLGMQDVDLLVNTSGTAEQHIPDTGVLIQRALGWGASGIPAFSVHATCLSFLVGLELAASLLALGRYRTLVLVSTEVVSSGLDWSHPENASLFGDLAVAAVLRRTPEGQDSALERYRLESYGDGAHLTQIAGGGSRLHPNHPDTRPEDNLFQMDGAGVMRMISGLAGPFLERVRPGLSTGLGDIDWVVPHQASRLGIASLHLFGMGTDRMIRTLDHYGNCVAASIPITLMEGIETGRIQRGQRLLLLGSGAGLSMGAAILRY